MGQKLLFVGLTMLASVYSFAGTVPLNLMPMPAKVSFGDGFLRREAHFVLLNDDRDVRRRGLWLLL